MGPPEPIVITGAEEEYEVESILRYYWWGQMTEYLVHWYGCNKAEYIWVLEQDFIHTTQVLQ